VKRIDDGTSTNQIMDQWIPRDGLLRPIACLVREPPSQVSDFIENSSATWNEGKLQQCFRPMDVEAILRIPLSHRRCDDFWARHYEKRGSSLFGRHTAC
jgi:hypothetical protein